jgi:two-component system phosphate regulon sensor histidine kinase PhoR
MATLASRAGEQERTAARHELLKTCAEAKTQAGRWIWPLVSLEALRLGQGDPLALAAWFESHRGMLGEPERTATVLEVKTSSLAGEAQQRVLAALGLPRSRRDGLTAVLRHEGVQTAMQAISKGAGPQSIPFRSEASAGALRALSDGRVAGFVVYAGSLTDALAAGTLALPEGIRAQVVEGSTAARPGTTAGSEPAGERLEALVEIAPLLALRLSLSDPAAVARRASKSRGILAGIGAGATAVAFLLAAALFARMRAARRLSALRTDFVATVSHELRTPIASVRMLAELLDEGRVEPEEQREVHTALAKEAKRLGDTIERLIGFSRMEANRQPMSRAAVPVAAVVAASIDAFDEQNAGAAAVVRALDTGVVASIDAAQIRLAADNLLANARKYAPEGGPYRVQVERARDGVAISVTDRGPGVKKRDQRRIFEPFERGDDRLSQATEGSGIGLSLVRHVARAHGGRVSVESEPGKGACFTLWIPARTE